MRSPAISPGLAHVTFPCDAFSDAAMASPGWGSIKVGAHRPLRTFQIDPKDLPICPVAGCLRGPRRCVASACCGPDVEAQTMSEPAGEERQSWASDIVWVVFYSILVLLFMLLWTSGPA
jgi:hypothetical protein